MQAQVEQRGNGEITLAAGWDVVFALGAGSSTALMMMAGRWLLVAHCWLLRHVKGLTVTARIHAPSLPSAKLSFAGDACSGDKSYARRERCIWYLAPFEMRNGSMIGSSISLKLFDFSKRSVHHNEALA